MPASLNTSYDMPAMTGIRRSLKPSLKNLLSTLIKKNKTTLIKTTNNRRFGVFFCNKEDKENKINSSKNITVNLTQRNININNQLNSYQTYRSQNFDYMNNNSIYNNNFFKSQDNIFKYHSNYNTLSADFKDYDIDKTSEIFNCKNKPDKFFAFSLNNKRNYFLNNKNPDNTPCLSINFDPNRESFYGKEKRVTRIEFFPKTGRNHGGQVRRFLPAETW